MLVAVLSHRSAVTDPLAYVFLAARILQSLIHLISISSAAVTLRFTAFAAQMAIAVYWAVRLLAAVDLHGRKLLRGAGARRAGRLRALPGGHGRLDAAEGGADGGAPAVRGAGRGHGHGLGQPAATRWRRSTRGSRWSASTSTRRWWRWRGQRHLLPQPDVRRRATSRRPVFPPGSLDGIFDSSVLHHVTSFGGYRHANAARGAGGAGRQLGPTACWSCATSSTPGRTTVLLDLPADDGDDVATTRARCSSAGAAGAVLARVPLAVADAGLSRSSALPTRRCPAAPGWRRYRLAHNTPPSSSCARTTAPTGRPR